MRFFGCCAHEIFHDAMSDLISSSRFSPAYILYRFYPWRKHGNGVGELIVLPSGYSKAQLAGIRAMEFAGAMCSEENIVA